MNKKTVNSLLKPQILFISLLLLGLGLLPLIGVDWRNYLLQIFILMFMNIILASSYDIVGGYMGYINLGHITFFALGAYGFGIFYNMGVGLVGGLILGVVVVLIFAALIAYPFFRLRGPYFSLAAFGLVKLMEYITMNLGWLTGGSNGIKIDPAERTVPMFYFTLGLVVLTVFVSGWIVRTPLGLAMKSIREDEEVARDFGVPTFSIKIRALMISSVFPALMGGLYLWYLNFINPGAVYGLKLALTPVAMALLGGSGLLIGPVLGATFLYLAEELIWTHIAHLHGAILGLVIVLVGLFMPGGLVRIPAVGAFLTRLGLMEEDK